MFKFKIVDREGYNNLIDLCDKVLAKNDELLSMAKELIELNNKILKHNDEIIEFNEHLLNLNGLSVNKENENAEN